MALGVYDLKKIERCVKNLKKKQRFCEGLLNSDIILEQWVNEISLTAKSE
jgi:hypothetical protein